MSEFLIELERYKTIEEVGEVGGWEINLKTRRVWWSPVTYRIHDLPADYDPTLEAGISFYRDGASRRAILEAVEDALQQGADFDVVAELVTRRQEGRWVHVTGKAVFENGVCSKIVGTVRDITLYKEHEAVLKARLEEAVREGQQAREALERVRKKLGKLAEDTAADAEGLRAKLRRLAEAE